MTAGIDSGECNKSNTQWSLPWLKLRSWEAVVELSKAEKYNETGF